MTQTNTNEIIMLPSSILIKENSSLIEKNMKNLNIDKTKLVHLKLTTKSHDYITWVLTVTII